MLLQSNYIICNPQNNTVKEIISNILDPLSYHFLDGTEKIPDKSTVSICHKGPNDEFSQESVKLSLLERVLPWLEGQTNWYMTTNQFTFGRPSENVNGLVMLTCDLDTYKSEKYADTTHEELICDVKSLCLEKNLPIPTIIMFSGKGYYLKWIFSQKIKVSKRDIIDKDQRKKYDKRIITKIDSWKIAQRVINKIFLEFGADMKATDISRILRMAGTINGKTVIDGNEGKRAEVLECRETISFEDMLHFLEPHTHEEDINEIVPQIKIKTVKEALAAEPKEQFEYIKTEKPLSDKPVSKNLIPKDLKQLQINREVDLWAIIKMRGGKAQEGYRMHYLLYMLCFRAGLGYVKPDNFHSEAKNLGDIIFGDDSFDMGALSSLEKRVEKYNDTHHLHKKGERSSSPLYIISNEKLISTFSITPEEQTHLKTIIGEEESNRRAKARKYADRRAKGMKEQIYSDNRTKPWEKLGIGKTSWKKYGKPDSLEVYHANVEIHKANLKANKKRDQFCPV